ncbi:hypothetical protein CLV51_104285 [Chitinophaga niastensis]|uniref:DUF4177 domain-containing protein n=1 Tax=Chitinophaga niastensis TaxID=536980 RepID=A0A2P8HHA9_CHINA|nr:hypothetical protein [Chitinophaga niastensis]PSL45579.1 hypothetical protein CLV51_104285 [Chitinophaga niastensis]
MKKQLILCLLILTIPAFLYAQGKIERFCELKAGGAGFNSKVTAQLNFGEGTRLIDFKDHRMKDSVGNVKKFKSIVDVLNFMSAKGWKLVTTFSEPAPNPSFIYFYFKKELDAAELNNFKPEAEFEM